MLGTAYLPVLLLGPETAFRSVSGVLSLLRCLKRVSNRIVLEMPTVIVWMPFSVSLNLLECVEVANEY